MALLTAQNVNVMALDAARQRRIQQVALHSAKKAASAASVGLLARSLAAARLRTRKKGTKKKGGGGGGGGGGAKGGALIDYGEGALGKQLSESMSIFKKLGGLSALDADDAPLPTAPADRSLLLFRGLAGQWAPPPAPEEEGSGAIANMLAGALSSTRHAGKKLAVSREDRAKGNDRLSHLRSTFAFALDNIEEEDEEDEDAPPVPPLNLNLANPDMWAQPELRRRALVPPCSFCGGQGHEADHCPALENKKGDRSAEEKAERKDYDFAMRQIGSLLPPDMAKYLNAKSGRMALQDVDHSVEHQETVELGLDLEARAERARKLAEEAENAAQID